MLCFGIEGEHYTRNDEKRVVKIENSGYTGFTGWEIGNQFNAWLLPGQEDSVWEDTAAWDLKADTSSLDGFVFDQTPVETEVAGCNAVVKEYSYIYAYDNYEELQKELNEKLYDAGLEKILKEIKKQIDEWRTISGK